MNDFELGGVQGLFADMIWKNEPIGSGELAKLGEKELNWKKSTTYTVLRRLCDKGLFKNEKGIVTSLISKEEYIASKSEALVENDFKGSLPAFIAAFMSRKKITEQEAAEIREMIDKYREG